MLFLWSMCIYSLNTLSISQATKEIYVYMYRNVDFGLLFQIKVWSFFLLIFLRFMSIFSANILSVTLLAKKSILYTYVRFSDLFVYNIFLFSLFKLSLNICIITHFFLHSTIYILFCWFQYIFIISASQLMDVVILVYT